ncbi:alpha/beta fold hydrolase [Pseudooceanicola marinus]|uniref:alpha/beta fold hydrolase n=1 Tax=Pseudooceanicola marinus TaxID=396013 RepID=UPI001CD2033D|nr:alpha/beta hydrolase [Pseudooceanicola marinus]MCA1336391.1 alpha/beta hydrolase [Pseudooceanicola marinus]
MNDNAVNSPENASESSQRLSPAHFAQLSHLIYDLALDNSRWAEMVGRIEALIDAGDIASVESTQGLEDLRRHVERAMEISDRLSAGRDEGELGRKLLVSLSVSFQLFDSDGQELSPELMSSQATAETFAGGHDGERRPRDGLPQALRRQYATMQQPMRLTADEEGAAEEILLGPNLVQKLGLPARVVWVRLRLTRDPQRIAANLGATYGLSPGRRKFLGAFLEHADLRKTSTAVDLSYESARTYLKDICQTIGLSGQTELIRAALHSPLSVLNADFSRSDGASVRHQIERPEGGVIEYFALGTPDGYPIIHYDALSGVGLDVLRFPEAFEPILNRLGARLIVPCRPGTFRSTFIRRKSAAGDAQDVGLLSAALGIDRFALISNSFGAISALHVAAAFQDRCDRVVLASVHNPDRGAERSATGNYLHKISAVIGRRSPLVLRWLIPFLCKSVIQDPGKFAQKAIDEATCDHEKAILSSPSLLRSVQLMLEERTASGFEGVIQEHRHIGRDLGFDLADLDVPLHLFQGDCDRMNSVEGAVALAEKAPRATLHILEGMGHSMIKAEWDWLLAAAAGADYDIPAADRRGPLAEALVG